MRKSLVVGNWKMHGSAASVAALVRDIVATLATGSATGTATGSAAGSATGTEGCGVEVAVCPVSVHIPLALETAAGALDIGAQNCSEHDSGAWTGEVAAPMLAELGCRWVILGHSERRRHYGETDALVAARARTARAAGLKPILCVGETLEEREQGRAQTVVETQLAALVEELQAGDVIAYEPVWAIGTGQTASPEQAQEMHAFVRGYLGRHAPELAQATRLLYGGSVKAANAAELFEQEDIDGGLVGGASLDADEFVAIARSAEDK